MYLKNVPRPRVLLSQLLLTTLAVTVLGMASSRVHADLVVNTVLALTPPSASENRMSISATSNVGSAATTADVSGTMNVALTFDNSLSLSDLTFNGASMGVNDFLLNFGGVVGSVNATGVSATITSPGGSQPVIAGKFDATQHNVAVMSGTLSGLGGLLVINLGPNQPSGSGMGQGSVQLTPTANPNEFTAQVTLPFALTDTTSLALISGNLSLAGTLVGSGLVTVPEPSAAIFLSLVGCATLVARVSSLRCRLAK